MDAFDAFQKYLAIKLHFNNKNYDFFKYNGKVTAQRSKFDTRSDKYHFHRLSKRYQDQLDLFLACNLLNNNKIWVGDLLEQECENLFKEHKKKLESLEYTFRTDMSQFDSLDEAFVVKSKGDWPDILYKYRRGQVSLETMVIIMLVAQCFDYWDANIDDDIIWPRMKHGIEKYALFIRNRIDIQKYSDIMKQLY